MSQETAVDLIDNTTVEELTPEQLERFKFDLAVDIQEESTLAKRYGLKDVRKFLADHPWLVLDIKRIKSLLQSESSIDERIDTKRKVIYEEALPVLGAKAMQGDMEALKEIRQGMQSSAAAKAQSGGAGTSFNLTMVFSDRTEKITTVVDPGIAIAPPADEE